MAGVGHLKRIFKDAFRVAGVVQKTCSSEMFGGQGAHFPRGFMFSCTKWRPASMGGTPFVRQVRLPLRLAPEWSPVSALRGGDL